MLQELTHELMNHLRAGSPRTRCARWRSPRGSRRSRASRSTWRMCRCAASEAGPLFLRPQKAPGVRAPLAAARPRPASADAGRGRGRADQPLLRADRAPCRRRRPSPPQRGRRRPVDRRAHGDAARRPPPAARRPHEEKKRRARPKWSRRADARARAQVRVVVHLHITDEDVKRAVAAFGNVAAAPEEGGAPRKKQRADY